MVLYFVHEALQGAIFCSSYSVSMFVDVFFRTEQEIEDQERPSPSEVAALYNAVEGSVMLLKVTCAPVSQVRLESWSVRREFRKAKMVRIE